MTAMTSWQPDFRDICGGTALPPVEDWHPAHCGDSQMRIAPDGTWFHQGPPIGRPELVRLFSTLLRKDEDGFVLVTPAEKLSIAVEDAPFIAVLLAAGRLRSRPASVLHHQCRRRGDGGCRTTRCILK